MTAEMATTRRTRRLSFFAAAAVVATGAFWATMLTSPPKSEAALPQGIDITRLTSAADPNMQSFDDKYQRHTGVLDVLNAGLFPG